MQRGRWATAATVLAAALAAAPADTGAAPADSLVASGAAFGAHFTLEISSPGAAAQRSEGMLYLLPDGRICLRVEAPVRQDMFLTKERFLLHYPDRALVLEGEIRKGQIPPVLDAVLAGLGEPSRLMPPTASLASRTLEGGVLRTLWTLPQEADGGSVEVAERADGVASLEIRARDGHARRRYDFGPRVRAARLKVPTTIRADYRDRSGAPSRVEAWVLQDVSAGVPGGLARACTGEGTATRREALAW